jgi:hypothetical protein
MLQRTFHRLHSQFGTAGLVIAMIALIVALAGTAIAAGGLTPSQEKQVTKIAKKFAGKPGATGATGPTGATGAAGKNGTDGTNGAPGTNGKSVESEAATAGECSTGGTQFKIGGASAGKACNGGAGATGKSVVLTAETEGANCEKGGTKVEVEGNAASKKYVCNGKEGSPWTASGTLPSGQTETGAWGIHVTLPETEANHSEGFDIPISFSIPLATELTEPEGWGQAPSVGCVTTPLPAACQVHLIKSSNNKEYLVEEAAPSGSGLYSVKERVQEAPVPCPGTAAAPTARAGNLCVYAAFISSPTTNKLFFGSNETIHNLTGAKGASTAGAVLSIRQNAAEPHAFSGNGSWAVTAP